MSDARQYNKELDLLFQEVWEKHQMVRQSHELEIEAFKKAFLSQRKLRKILELGLVTQAQVEERLDQLVRARFQTESD